MILFTKVNRILLKFSRKDKCYSARQLSEEFLARRASAGRLMFCFCYFLSFFFFNDRVEQRDLGNYQTDPHQIFRGGTHVDVDIQSGIGFAIGQGTLPWQPILGAKLAEIGDTPSSWDSHSQWMIGTAERICVKFTRKTCLVLCSDKFEHEGQKSKVKVTRDKTRCALTTPPRYGRNGTLQITSRKQQMRRFDRCRGVASPGCMRWAWRATAGLCQAFLVS